MSNNISKFGGKLVAGLVAIPDTHNSTPEDLAFMDAIRKKLRGIQFKQAGLCYWAYYPDELFARGLISFADIRENYGTGERKATYNVSSPYIENNKTGIHNPALFFRLSSVNINTAVRNAVKYLREYTPTDIVRATIRLASEARNNLSHNEAGEIRQLCRNVCGSLVMEKSLRNELMHLHNAGHQFVDPEYGSNVAQYFTKHAEHVENDKARVSYTFVYVKTINGRHEFTCIDINDLNSVADAIRTAYSSSKDEVRDANARVTYELPDDVLSKVSVLTVGGDNTFLDGVGYKYCDEVYYVYK
jgi:hypothetical protein